MAVMSDPEGCFREKHFRERLASKNVRWDPQPGEAAWRIGVLDKVLDVIKICELHDVHLTTHHLQTCLTTVQKQTTNFIGDKGSHPFNGSSEVHHLDYHWKMRQNWEKSVHPMTTEERRRLHIQRECYK